MTRNSLGFTMMVAELCNRQVPPLDGGELKQFVKTFIQRKEEFLQAAARHGSPLYLIDNERLSERARTFRETFTRQFGNVRVYYALKSNSHPQVATTLMREGINLDVSSGLELTSALDMGAEKIIFSGPGKQPQELELAVANSDHVTVLIDSFAELERLNKIAKKADRIVTAGVRLTTEDHGIWRKFGIPLDRLKEFFKVADSCSHIDLRGLQFHISWNLTPEAQVMFITRLGGVLRQLKLEHQKMIEFIDIGGGFWPQPGEWLQPGATPLGMLQTAIDEHQPGGLDHFAKPAAPLQEFASHLHAALKQQIPSTVNFTLCLEPGRWLCHEGMHILLTVVDVKRPDVVITDGGTNAIGWDRFETDYFPVINLTHPGLHEHECLIAGSLCTPHDLWGYNYFGEKIKEGDILLVPNQGAYTWSLRQEFIKPLPKVANLFAANRANQTDHLGVQAGGNE